jgi:hypothetical protein
MTAALSRRPSSSASASPFSSTSFSGALVVAAASAVGTMVAYGVILGPISEVEWPVENVLLPIAS